MNCERKLGIDELGKPIKCGKPIEDDVKYVSYLSNGSPIYWNRCSECIKAMWLEYRDGK